MTVTNAREIVDRYFSTMAKRDFATMRTLIHDDISFKGPLGITNTVDDYLKGVEQTLANMERIERRVVVAEGEDVWQLYDLVLIAPAVTVSIAQWFKIRGNRIAMLQVFFDPRPMMQP